MNHRRFVLASIGGIVALAFTMATAPQAQAQKVSQPEQKCNQSIGKAGRKLASTITKSNAKCREGDISGKTPGACPDVKSVSKIDKARLKLVGAAEKSCHSTCSTSTDIDCVSDSLCPPEPNPSNAGATEFCAGDGKQFRMEKINFPGAFCEGVIGGPVISPAGIGECASVVTDSAANNIVTAIYGSLASASLTDDAAAQKCLKALSKSTHKLSDTIYNGVISCIGDIQKGKILANPDTCKSDIDKISSKIDKAQQKLADSANKSCTAGDVAKLDLCLNGVGGTLTVQAAIDCLTDMAFEMTDTVEPAAFRTYGPNALTEATYPPAGGVCGDAVVNQGPNPFLLLGEECDLTDDSACPAQCAPPGDLLECTCPGPRNRYFANGITSDLDSGWTGTSHNQGVTDGAGFFYTLENCDCDAFTDATCTGSSSDPVCDIQGQTAPSCSWDPFSSITGLDCDGNGNHNGLNRNDDCHICDQFSANSGSFCRGTQVADCQAQCFAQDDLTTPVGLCSSQADCAGGQICLGTCDRSPICVITPNGSNLPISSGGTAVCVVTTFRSGVTGTNNIVTGEHAWDEFQFSKVILGVSNYQPCPLCGGFCDDGPSNLQGKPCEGSCDGDADVRCRFDQDCIDAAAGAACLDDAPECGSGRCNLGLICFGGPNNGSPCRVEALTKIFGTTSNDCPPDLGQNISAEGLEINFLPMTTNTVTLQNTGCFNGSTFGDGYCATNADCPGGDTCQPRPCEGNGFSNYGCPCNDGKETEPNAVATKPNDCAMACNDGTNFGQPCAAGNERLDDGLPTTCTIQQCLSGVNRGDLCTTNVDCGFGNTCQNLGCDEDADCPGGSCSVNPTQCSGGPASDEGSQCANNGDCDAPGVCGDACPGGRCVPLCLPSTDPLFSAHCSEAPQTECTTNGDCGLLGGTCEAYTESEEGFCAGGTDFFHCSGFTDSFRICFASSAGASCGAVCAASCSESGAPSGGSGTPCQGLAECPAGEICCGDCELANLCEAGNDGIMGNGDDNPGAGVCFGDVRNCFVTDATSTGTASGVPDATAPSSNTIYCTPPTLSNSINAVAGLGGPGRLRQEGVNVPMYTQLP